MSPLQTYLGIVTLALLAGDRDRFVDVTLHPRRVRVTVHARRDGMHYSASREVTDWELSDFAGDIVRLANEHAAMTLDDFERVLCS